MGGIDAKNKTNFIASFRCTMCLLILRDPVQLTCGHRLCKSCSETTTGESIKCPQCEEESMKKDIILDRGCKIDMHKLPIDCYLCDWTGIFGSYEIHLQRDHPNPKCTYCGRIFESLDILNTHVTTECDQVTVPCILKEFGCVDSIVRAQINEHYLTTQHQQAIINALHLTSTIKHSSPQDGNASSMDINTTENIILDKDIRETIDTVVGGLEALSDDTHRIHNESLRLQLRTEEFKEEITAVKLSIEEDRAFLEGMRSNQEIIAQDVASLKERMEEMQSVSYDGSYIWKITSVKEKMRDAESERQTSIYSPPFYSSSSGYKMRARLYLHGDGNARRTHISLFFVLMRSQYDAMLKFPFNYKVTFCMYDQTGAQRHIIDSFRPDIRSNSFQRPRSEMNIASGIPKFFPLTMIQQENNPYVQNDTIFIKIMVDFGDMPKTVLPYVMSLNPGIPIIMQQDMIKQEIERRTQQSSTSVSETSQKK